MAALAGAFSLGGVFLGATLSGSHASRENELERYWALANDAATDFLSGQSALQLHSTDRERCLADLKIRDASIRIAVFAPAHVVRAVANYVEILAPRPPCEDGRAREEVLADLDIYRSIRQTTAGELDKVGYRDLAMVIWGCVFEARAG